MAEPRYIAIEGPIGVGKTSLAKRLAAHYDSELLLEEAAANPFLSGFYEDARKAALQTQLFFLFQRVNQLEKLRQSDLFGETRVADFLMDKDRLFAQITLDQNELKLYDQVRSALEFEPPAPDLVVYLQAPVDTLIFRIGRRGIGYEQSIRRRYLEQLTDAYSRFFYDYNASPLLIVNASEIDPVNNDQHFQMLANEIDATRSGRQFFNPLSSALG
ncbi:MAG: deoxynucleoside kinase [Gammaproteobacteria bacterium]|nr:deoxynucleoside kinase [Gammaproteobacteria bacterium]